LYQLVCTEFQMTLFWILQIFREISPQILNLQKRATTLKYLFSSEERHPLILPVLFDQNVTLWHFLLIS